MKRADTLLLNSGGMGSLVATAIASRESHIAMLFVFDGRPGQSHYHECFARQAEYFGLDYTTVLHMNHLRGTDDHGQQIGMAHQQLILAASGLAGQMNAQKLVWPIHVGEDFELVASVTEQIILLEQLAELELGHNLQIETPLLEMPDKELLEVGHQMNVPWELSRSCTMMNANPCRGCEKCRRRTIAFQQTMLTDPLIDAISQT